MSTHDADVVIVGGGPVGMGLAIELGQRGVRTLVVERYPEPQPVPKGQNLTQRTMEHFHAWGAEPALRAARTIPPGYGIGGLTAYRTLLSGWHYDWLQRDLVRQYYFQANERLPQYATERVLRARAVEIDAIDIRYGWTASSLIDEDDQVRVVIRSRDGQEAEVRGRYLVGCDGARSVVREGAGITQTLSDHDRLMVLLVFRSEELNRLLERFPGKSYYNVLHPRQKGYWLFFGRVNLEGDWFFHAPVPKEARDGDFDFATLLHEAVGAPFDVAIEHVGFWDLRFAIADTYGKGRVFIAGDAAHSHPPYGGYGINTGFEDARNLGWKLAAVMQGWGGSDLFDSYTTERRGVFASTARDFIAKAIECDRDFLDSHDPEIDPVAFESAWSDRAAGAAFEVARFEPNYCGSPVVMGAEGIGCGAVGSHTFAAEAGRHLAPLELASGDNIYDVLGNGFSLVAIGEPSAISKTVGHFTEAARQCDMPLEIIVDHGTALKAYAASYILVRPDGFVAWAAHDAPKGVTSATLILEKLTGHLRERR